MAKSFNLAIYPWVYSAKFDGIWQESFTEQRHLDPTAEHALPDEEREQIYLERNRFHELPLVNFTTQYGLGCFEGAQGISSGGWFALAVPAFRQRYPYGGFYGRFADASVSC